MPLSMGEWEEGRAACFIGGGGQNKLFSKKDDSGAVIFTDDGPRPFSRNRLEDITQGNAVGFHSSRHFLPSSLNLDRCVRDS